MEKTMKLFMRNLLSIVITILLFSVTNNVFSQSIKIDSLQQILTETEDDSSKSEILVQLAESVISSDKGKAIKYYTEASELEISKKKKAILFNTVGLYNWQLGNFKETIIYYNKALELFTELEDSVWLGRIYNNIGSVNWGLGNSNEALEYYHLGLKIRRKIDDKNGVALILNNIGLIYYGWGQNDEALVWYKKALDVAFEIDSYVTISYSYSNIGKSYEKNDDIKEALKYYLLGYDYLIARKKDSRSINLFLLHIGDAYKKMGKLNEAFAYYKKSLVHAKKIKNANRIAISEYTLGRAYFEINQIDSATFYANRSYEKSFKNSYNNLVKDNLFLLSSIEETKGNSLKALEYFKKATVVKDSLFNQKKIAKFTDLQIKYDLEQKSQENELLKKNNKIQEFTIKEG